MSYFPESIMPSRIKSEAADVDGNKFIVSASDANEHDEEIRSVEKVIGVPKLPVDGGPVPEDDCSLLAALQRIAEQINAIRDDLVQTTSGVVAVKDSNVVGVDGLIPFPASWTTTLQDVLDDASTDDETVLGQGVGIALADVTGMPDEGYVTIINDVTLAAVPIVHSGGLVVYSPTIANGKINKDFLYEILSNYPAAAFSTSTLPSGLVLNGNMISGVPATTGTFTINITVAAPSQQATLTLTLTVVAADTPQITSSTTLNATAGTPFVYTLTFTGVPDQTNVTGLPGGMTFYGNKISGTPRIPGTYPLTVTISDEFGDSDTKSFSLIVS